MKNDFGPELATSFRRAVSATPGSSLTLAARLSGSNDREKSETSAWKSPKSA